MRVLSARSWNSVAFIEASLEELPVSANLGQSFLATKISAPGPSIFGWFRHNRHLHPPLRGVPGDRSPLQLVAGSVPPQGAPVQLLPECCGWCRLLAAPGECLPRLRALRHQQGVGAEMVHSVEPGALPPGPHRPRAGVQGMRVERILKEIADLST